MSRRRRSNKRSNKKTGAPVLLCLNPNAAGVDIGATEIYVAVPEDREQARELGLQVVAI